MTDCRCRAKCRHVTTSNPDGAAGCVEECRLRLATDNLTAVMGVMKGTFSKPMPDGKGGTIAPTGKAFAVDMVTVGIWNRQGTMDEEFLFWDNRTFYGEMGLS